MMTEIIKSEEQKQKYLWYIIKIYQNTHCGSPRRRSERKEGRVLKKYDRKLTKFGERYEYTYPKRSTINCKMNKIPISYR